MKHKILPIILTAVVLGGCSSAYKSTQTPDDVYYSPVKAVSEKEAEKVSKQNDRYEDYVSSTDARYLRMKVHNYTYWSSLDDYSYWNDSRYDFSSCAPSRYSIWSRYSSCGCNNNYYAYGGYYNGWGGYYNAPISYVIGYKNPKTSIGTVSSSYLSTYKNSSYNNNNYNNKTNPNPGGFGSLIRQVFSPSNSNTSSNSNSSWDRPARTFSTPTNSSTSTPAPQTSSSAGGNSGGYGSTGSSSSTPRATRQ